jgi:coproporphyrinogen III oxidase
VSVRTGGSNDGLQVGGLVWTGGGCDLTPNYLTYVAPSHHEALSDAADSASASPSGGSLDLQGDIRDFHARWQALCNEYDASLYGGYKEWCDRCDAKCCSVSLILSNV